MIKLLSIAALLASAMTLGAGCSAFAQGLAPSTEVPRTTGQMPTRYQPGGIGVAANGRCGGVSFGTGARRCGDLSGGPSGGLTSRN